MNVTAAARAAGISPSGLRWYESRGVLPPAPRSENGYRKYTASDVSQLRLVLTLALVVAVVTLLPAAFVGGRFRLRTRPAPPR